MSVLDKKFTISDICRVTIGTIVFLSVHSCLGIPVFYIKHRKFKRLLKKNLYLKRVVKPNLLSEHYHYVNVSIQGAPL